MANYTQDTNFAAKDSLPSGAEAKKVKGTEIYRRVRPCCYCQCD